MKKEIKLIVSDLDGTLIDGKLQATKQDLETLEVLKKRGIPVVAATGRGFKSAKDVTSNMNISEYLICFQGAAIFYKEEVIWHRSVGSCLPFLEMLRERKIGNVGVLLHHTDGVMDLSVLAPAYAESADYLSKYGGLIVSGDKLTAAASEDLTKFVYFGKLDELLEVQSEWLKIGQNRHIVLSSDYTLDITHEEAKKGIAATRLAEMMGFSMDQVLAIGDNYNDQDLLQSAGIGVAMQTAPDEVKKEADYVTRSVEDSGFTEAIYKFVLD